MNIRLLLLCMTLSVLILSGGGGSVSAANVVLCHDVERDVVSRTKPKDCDGAVVTKEEAKKIKARRRARMMKAVKPEARRVYPDRRLSSIGTGFFIDAGGTVVTNNHVIADCPALAVQTTAGEMAEAVLLGVDERMDLALLKAEITPPATAVFQAPVKLAEGGTVVVVGYPTKTLPVLKPKLSSGTFDSNQSDGTHFTMNAVVRPGNSGGPVFDDRGHVIGVVVATIDTPGTFKDTGKMIVDLGFAISNRTVFRFLDRIKARYELEDGGAAMTGDEIFDHARPLITRITCWK